MSHFLVALIAASFSCCCCHGATPTDVSYTRRHRRTLVHHAVEDALRARASTQHDHFRHGRHHRWLNNNTTNDDDDGLIPSNDFNNSTGMLVNFSPFRLQIGPILLDTSSGWDADMASIEMILTEAVRITLQGYLNDTLATALASLFENGNDDGTRLGYVRVQEVTAVSIDGEAGAGGELVRNRKTKTMGDFVEGTFGTPLDFANDENNAVGDASFSDDKTIVAKSKSESETTRRKMQQSLQTAEAAASYITMSISGGQAFYLFGRGGIFFSSVPSQTQLDDTILNIFELEATAGDGGSLFAEKLRELSTSVDNDTADTPPLEMFQTVETVTYIAAPLSSAPTTNGPTTNAPSERPATTAPTIAPAVAPTKTPIADPTVTPTTSVPTTMSPVNKTLLPTIVPTPQPMDIPMTTAAPSVVSIAPSPATTSTLTTASPIQSTKTSSSPTATTAQMDPTNNPSSSPTNNGNNNDSIGSIKTSNNNDNDNGGDNTNTIAIASSAAVLAAFLLAAALFVKRRNSSGASGGRRAKEHATISPMFTNDLYGSGSSNSGGSHDGDNFEEHRTSQEYRIEGKRGGGGDVESQLGGSGGGGLSSKDSLNKNNYYASSLENESSNVSDGGGGGITGSGSSGIAVGASLEEGDHFGNTQKNINSKHDNHSNHDSSFFEDGDKSHDNLKECPLSSRDSLNFPKTSSSPSSAVASLARSTPTILSNDVHFPRNELEQGLNQESDTVSSGDLLLPLSTTIVNDKNGHINSNDKLDLFAPQCSKKDVNALQPNSEHPRDNDFLAPTEMDFAKEEEVATAVVANDPGLDTLNNLVASWDAENKNHVDNNDADEAANIRTFSSKDGLDSQQFFESNDAMDQQHSTVSYVVAYQGTDGNGNNETALTPRKKGGMNDIRHDDADSKNEPSPTTPDPKLSKHAINSSFEKNASQHRKNPANVVSPSSVPRRQSVERESTHARPTARCDPPGYITTCIGDITAGDITVITNDDSLNSNSNHGDDFSEFPEVTLDDGTWNDEPTNWKSRATSACDACPTSTKGLLPSPMHLLSSSNGKNGKDDGGDDDDDDDDLGCNIFQPWKEHLRDSFTKNTTNSRASPTLSDPHFSDYDPDSDWDVDDTDADDNVAPEDMFATKRSVNNGGSSSSNADQRQGSLL